MPGQIRGRIGTIFYQDLAVGDLVQVRRYDNVGIVPPFLVESPHISFQSAY
jgi:hypothetical protein